MLELGDDCASQDHKNHVNECPLTGMHKNFWVCKLCRYHYIMHVTSFVDIFVVNIVKKRYSSDIASHSCARLQ